MKAMVRVTRSLLVTVLGVGLVVGCAPAPTAVIAPSPLGNGIVVHPTERAVSEQASDLLTADRVFATSEVALNAATQSYRNYLAVLDAITGDGGASPERIRSLVSPQFDLTLDITFESFRNSGIRTRGDTRLVGTALLGYTEAGSGIARVDLEACLDISGTRAQDASGNNVTPEGRQEHPQYRVSLATVDDDPGHLLVTGTRALHNTLPCDA